MKFDEALRGIMGTEGFERGMYDEIRLIDPVSKDVLAHIKHQGCESVPCGHKCFDFFGRTVPCENCSSMLALQKKEQVVKIDAVGANVYLTTAQPLDEEGGQYVVETLKNITRSGMVGIEGVEVIALNRLLEQRNSMMLRDVLTKIYRENFVDIRLPHNVYQVKAENRRLSLIHVGIKNLREINDAHGFHIGDDVIRQSAAAMKKCAKKPEDWVARYSGSEILMALFDLDEKETMQACSRIFNRLGKVKVPEGQAPSKALFAIGFIQPDGESADTAALVAAARKNAFIPESRTKTQGDTALLQKAFPGLRLSEREEETALLLLSGRSNQEIAQALYISLSTVKKHIAKVLKETGAKSRGEFIAKGLR